MGGAEDGGRQEGMFQATTKSSPVDGLFEQITGPLEVTSVAGSP